MNNQEIWWEIYTMGYFIYIENSFQRLAFLLVVSP